MGARAPQVQRREAGNERKAVSQEKQSLRPDVVCTARGGPRGPENSGARSPAFHAIWI